MSNRRKDHELRSAVDRLRQDHHLKTDLNDIYSRTLDEVISITRSARGCLIEVITLPGSAEEYQVVVLRNSTTSMELTAELNLPLKLRNFGLFRTAYSNTIVQIYQSQSDQLTKVDFDQLGWHLPTQLMVIPLVDREIVFGLLCIADSKNDYKPDLAKYIWPLLTTCACVRSSIAYSTRSRDITPSDGSSDFEYLEHKLRQIERNSFEGIIEINKNHKITRFNPAAERIFNITAANAIGQEITVFLPERFPNEHRIRTFSTTKFLEASPFQHNFLARSNDDKSIPVDIAATSHRINGQTYFTLLIQDNSELQSVQHRQNKQTQRFKAVSDLAPIGIIQTTSQWECIYVNDRWCDICKVSPDAVKGMGWINAIYQEDVQDILSKMREAVKIGQELNVECRFQTTVGDIVWVELHARPMFTEYGDIDGFLATLSDKSYRRIMEQKLRNMAELDALTGLANRFLLQDRLEQALRRLDRRQALILLCLDLDGFKLINDSLGHDVGDSLLKEVAKRITSCVRNEDTVARVGGDEFIILMEDVKLAHIASEISDKILAKLTQSFSIAYHEVFITTSIGISVASSEHPANSRTLLKQADIALYRAKEEGRNQFQYYSAEMEKQTKNRLYLGNSLHRALQHNEFEVFYQLQSTLTSQSVVGSEALLRWRHPDRGLLSPAEFIPMLEETGLISPVCRRLLNQAFVDHHTWIEKELISRDSHISVNLAPRQLRELTTVTDIVNALLVSGLSGANVVMEITESALLEETKITSEVLHQLKKLGVKIALDDFGTGYSSLTYLKRFPIDFIKIDKTFIRDILTDSNDKAITKAIIMLAKSLGLTVIAEGVENSKILNLLGEWGCHCYQGYLLGKPCNSTDIQTLLTSSKNNKSKLPMFQNLTTEKPRKAIVE